MGAHVGKSGGYLLDSIPSQGTMHVVMLGLDSAGKTTALYRLKFDQYLNTVPTIGFNCEKIHGTLGKAKGVQFLIWDVGGQEKLRPLWRSYTRCTDGILFVVDSVDLERIEEAKMELMRTAKCPDNQGVPVLILANKQDLPGACDPNDLEKFLGLQELAYPTMNLSLMSSSSSSTGNIVGSNSGSNTGGNKSLKLHIRSLTPTASHSRTFESENHSRSSSNTAKDLTNIQQPIKSMSVTSLENKNEDVLFYENKQRERLCFEKDKPSAGLVALQYKGWYIQPACAITGEGLHEGLEALYEMILKQRKLKKMYKKKR